MTRIALHRLPSGEGLPLPARATAGAAGFDLPAAADLTLDPGARALVPTGFAMTLPPGWEGQVRPRSGLAWKHGVTVLNAPGTIDADYRGEIGVLLVNHGTAPVAIARGDRIAQIVVVPVPPVTLEESDAPADTPRGSGGFGSTG